MHDAVVVGAGPGGSMAARTLAQAGFDVQIVDKKRVVGEPIQCAEGMSQHAFDLNGLETDPSWILTRIKGAICVPPNGHRFYITRDPGYAIDRARFDRWLAQEAVDRGARLAVNTRIQEVRRRDDGWVAFDAKGGEHRGRVLVAADGPTSAIATRLGLLLEKDFIQGYQYKFPAAGVPFEDTDHFYLYVAGRYRGGYAFVFPRGDQFNVGVGGHVPASLILGDFCRRMGFDVAARTEINAGIIPHDYRLAAYSRDGVVVVGDAAGVTNPINGGGIHPALYSGRVAGEAAVRALEAEDLSRLAEYDRVLRDSPYLDPLLWEMARRVRTWEDEDFDFLADAIDGGEITALSYLRGLWKSLRRPRFLARGREFLRVKRCVDLSVVYGW